MCADMSETQSFVCTEYTRAQVTLTLLHGCPWSAEVSTENTLKAKHRNSLFPNRNPSASRTLAPPGCFLPHTREHAVPEPPRRLHEVHWQVPAGGPWASLLLSLLFGYIFSLLCCGCGERAQHCSFVAGSQRAPVLNPPTPTAPSVFTRLVPHSKIHHGHLCNVPTSHFSTKMPRKRQPPHPELGQAAPLLCGLGTDPPAWPGGKPRGWAGGWGRRPPAATHSSHASRYFSKPVLARGHTGGTKSCFGRGGAEPPSSQSLPGCIFQIHVQQ